jgi:hypothetical protein
MPSNHEVLCAYFRASRNPYHSSLSPQCPQPADSSLRNSMIYGSGNVTSVFDGVSHLLQNSNVDIIPWNNSIDFSPRRRPGYDYLQQLQQQPMNNSIAVDLTESGTTKNDISSMRYGSQQRHQRTARNEQESIVAKPKSSEETSVDTPGSSSASPSYSVHQTSRWGQRYQDLIEFRKEYGHCVVPSYLPKNMPLALWIKRQRSQFKLKKEGKHSNMTDEREQILSSLGFVWDSHAAFWEERLGELRTFQDEYGHSNVPTKYPENPQLAIWAKCQRRQFKLFTQGEHSRSHMTLERISKLASVGFVFDPRKMRRMD